MTTTRPSEASVHMGSAYLWSTRSTCSRLHVGAVLTRDGRTISSGYNGNMAGADPCDHTCGCPVPQPPEGLHLPDCRSLQPCTTAVHAESNALAFAAKYGVSTLHSHLYVTHAPCAGCARLLVNAGIARVTYAEAYRSTAGLAVLNEAGVYVHQLSKEAA